MYVCMFISQASSFTRSIILHVIVNSWIKWFCSLFWEHCSLQESSVINRDGFHEGPLPLDLSNPQSSVSFPHSNSASSFIHPFVFLHVHFSYYPLILFPFFHFSFLSFFSFFSFSFLIFVELFHLLFQLDLAAVTLL